LTRRHRVDKLSDPEIVAVAAYLAIQEPVAFRTISAFHCARSG
jgi:cytochrome c553